MKIGVVCTGSILRFARKLEDMARIHTQHKSDEITCITTRESADLAGRTGYFNQVWAVDIPSKWQILSCFLLKNRFRDFRFDRVYNLSNEGFFKHRQTHTPPKDLDVTNHWADYDLGFYQLPARFFVINMDQFNPDRPALPLARLTALCRALAAPKIRPVLVGSHRYQDEARKVENLCPEALNLCGQLDLFEMAALSRQADFWIGYECAASYLAAFCDCKTLCLYDDSQDVQEQECPHGQSVIVFQADMKSTRATEITRILNEQGWLI
tara:strand:- start:4514 stop:5317 length:804 start_codon:yes stop_codon:yes gene_type:complete